MQHAINKSWILEYIFYKLVCFIFLNPYSNGARPWVIESRSLSWRVILFSIQFPPLANWHFMKVTIRHECANLPSLLLANRMCWMEYCSQDRSQRINLTITIYKAINLSCAGKCYKNNYTVQDKVFSLLALNLLIINFTELQ